jgi:hypothetical protein
VTETVVDPDQIEGSYLRRWARNKVSIPTKIDVILQGGKKYTSGSAMIRDISLKGARLGKFVLKKPSLPIRPFVFHLYFQAAKYEGVGAVAKPIRFGEGNGFEIVVLFEDFWATALDKGKPKKKSSKKKKA